MSDVSSTPTPVNPSRRDRLRDMARQIRDPRLSTGARASLRRGAPHDVARQAAFFRILSEQSLQYDQVDELIAWATVAQCMAITGIPLAAGAESDGTVLARAGLTESRFARLLASHGEGMRDQMLLIARYLHSKDASVAWNEMGELILTDDRSDERANDIRLRLARDYYRALLKQATS